MRRLAKGIGAATLVLIAAWLVVDAMRESGLTLSVVSSILTQPVASEERNGTNQGATDAIGVGDDDAGKFASGPLPLLDESSAGRESFTISVLWPEDASRIDPPHEVALGEDPGMRRVPLPVGSERTTVMPVRSAGESWVLSCFGLKIAEGMVDPSSTELTIDARTLPAVRGRVLGAGRPIEGAWVQIYSSYGDDSSWCEARADDDGRFLVPALPGDRLHRAIAGAPGWTTATTHRVVPARPDSTGEVVFELSPAMLVTGRVLTQSGEQVAGATVTLLARQASPRATTADEQGGFRFEGVSLGVLDLVASHPKAGVGWFSAQMPPQDPVDIHLTTPREAQILEGVVRWSDGLPAEGVLLSAWPVRVQGRPIAPAVSLKLERSCVSGPHGAFQFVDLAGEEVELTTVSVVAGFRGMVRTPGPVLIELARPEKLVVTIQPMLEGGAPLAAPHGAQWRLVGADWQTTGPCDIRGRDLEATLTGPPGLVADLLVSIPGYSTERLATGVLTDIGPGPFIVMLVGHQHRSVEVLDASGRPIAQARVSAYWAADAHESTSTHVDLARDTWFSGEQTVVIVRESSASGVAEWKMPRGRAAFVVVQAGGFVPSLKEIAPDTDALLRVTLQEVESSVHR